MQLYAVAPVTTLHFHGGGGESCALQKPLRPGLELLPRLASERPCLLATMVSLLLSNRKESRGAARQVARTRWTALRKSAIRAGALHIGRRATTPNSQKGAFSGAVIPELHPKPVVTDCMELFISKYELKFCKLKPSFLILLARFLVDKGDMWTVSLSG